MNHNDDVHQEKYRQFIEPLMEKMDLVFMQHEPCDMINNLWECLMIRTDPYRNGSDYVHAVGKHLITLIGVAEGLVECDARYRLRVHDTHVQPVSNTAFAPGMEKMKATIPAVLQAARLSVVNYADYLDPYRVLYQFFEEQPKALWERQVGYWCGRESLSAVPPELSVGMMLANFKSLAKLIEACYLLTEIEWNGNINTPIDYFFQAEYMPAGIPVEDMLNPYEAVCYCFLSEGPENLLRSLAQWEQAVLNKEVVWQINADSLRMVHSIQYVVEFAYVLSAIPYLHKSWVDTRTWKIDLSPGLPAAPELLSAYTMEELENPFKLLRALDGLAPGAFRELAFEWLMVAGSPDRYRPADKGKFERVRRTIEVLFAATEFVVRQKTGDWLPDIAGSHYDPDVSEDC